MQPYQFNKLLEQKRMQSEITSIFKESSERGEKRKQLAARLGVTEEQVGAIALDYLLQATEKMTTTTIRLPEDLKARIAIAAKRSGKSTHAFILDAIAKKTEQ